MVDFTDPLSLTQKLERHFFCGQCAQEESYVQSESVFKLPVQNPYIRAHALNITTGGQHDDCPSGSCLPGALNWALSAVPDG